jgi:DNA topoisomerase II
MSCKLLVVVSVFANVLLGAGIPKLDDANDAGGRASEKCTLILTEGDSAKALAISGLSVVGRDHYGVFPLRGKLLNVRDASALQV